MPRVYAIATCDSKGAELVYLAERIRACGVELVTVDVGTRDPSQIPTDLSREQVAACHPDGAGAVLGKDDRGEAVSAMAAALTPFLLREHERGELAGVIGLGGSGGTALITPALQALPVGLPKLMVSTVASGNTAPYVGCSDIGMLYSVTDVAGINKVSRVVLGNAAHAIAGMAGHAVPTAEDRPCIGLSMFGVTTPCVTEVRERLEAEGYDCLVFHATGTGGNAMEKLVASGLIEGVLDITTTEVCDQVVGGVFDPGPGRFDGIVEAGIPYVCSVGALDMVNFGAEDTVPAQFRDRTLHVHNAQVTLMRTTPDENRQFARFITGKLNRHPGPLRFLIPEGGVSLLDAEGQSFHDPEADAALFQELESTFDASEQRRIQRFPHHINDAAFADALVAAWHEVRDAVIAKA